MAEAVGAIEAAEKPTKPAPTLPDLMDQMSGMEPGMGTIQSIPSLKRVKTPEEYAALEPGTQWIDPEGKTRQKPYTPKDQREYGKVPEGAQWMDPEGNLREKEKFEGVGFGAQTLYDMAINDKERRKALEVTWGAENVKEDPATGELMIEKDGVRMKPGHGLSPVPAALTAMAAPVTGAVIGSFNPTAPVASTIGGALLGQVLNDGVMLLAGASDRGWTEEFMNQAKAGLGALVGYGVGGGAAAMFGLSSAGGQMATRGLPFMAAHALGATPEGTETALRLAEKGVKSPISRWAPEAPYLKKVQEQFDPAFREQDVLFQSATEHYRREAEALAQRPEIDLQATESLIGATEKPSSAPFGAAAIRRWTEEARAADADITRTAEAARAMQQNIYQHETLPAYQDLLHSMERAAVQSREAAQNIIDASFDRFDRAIRRTERATETDMNPGALHEALGETLTANYAAFRKEADKLYDTSRTAGRGHIPVGQDELAPVAQRMLEQLPEDFHSFYPHIVQKIANIAEGAESDFVELHRLRTMLRNEVDWGKVAHTVREGPYIKFQNMVDKIMKDVEGNPDLKPAVRLLKNADKFYGENINKYHDSVVRMLTTGARQGIPVEPSKIAALIFREGYAPRRREIQEMLGPAMWAAVKRAEEERMLQASWDGVAGAYNAGKYAAEVEKRIRMGLFSDTKGGFTKQTQEKMLRQARRIQMMEGKLDFNAYPGDSVAQQLARADYATREVERMVANDPLRALEEGLAQSRTEEAAALKANEAARKQDPLNFLSEMRAMPMAAADKILQTPDLILATAARFGENSQEFEALRQVYVHRLLQAEQRSGNPIISKLSDKLANIEPNVQELMFPGTTLADLKQIAKDMDFLLGGRYSDVGGSMAAASRVLNPWRDLPGFMKPVSMIPGGTFAARLTVGNYYKLVSWGLTHPRFIGWVAKGLREGSPVDRQVVKESVQEAFRKGRVYGAGTGEAIEQAPGEEAAKGRRPPGFPENARRAPDGKYYVPDPNRQGKYMMVQ